MDAMRMFSQTTWSHQVLLQRRGCRVHSASMIRGLFSSQPVGRLERLQAGLLDLLSLGVTPFPGCKLLESPDDLSNGRGIQAWRRRPSLRRLTSSGGRRNRHCRSGRHIDRPCHRLQAALANRVDWSTRRTRRSRRHDATRRACACPTRCKEGDGHGGMVMVAGKRGLCGGRFCGRGGCGWG